MRDEAVDKAVKETKKNTKEKVRDAWLTRRTDTRSFGICNKEAEK